MSRRLASLMMAAIGVAWLFGGCSHRYTSEATLCIPPNDTSGYAPDLRRQDAVFLPRRRPMPRWWEPQLGLFQRGVPLLVAPNDVVARSAGQLWIAGHPDDSKNSIVRYDLNAHENKQYAILGPGGIAFVADSLLVARDGSLWAHLSLLSSEHDYSVLAKYDEAKDRFDVVTDKDGLLIPSTTGPVHTIFSRPEVLAEEPDGRLVVVLDGKIYLYDAVENRARQILGSNSGLNVRSIAPSKDGHIWFVGDGDLSIRELDPGDGRIWDYGPPPGINGEGVEVPLADMPKPLEVDAEGRVWVGDYGWLETTNEGSRYAWHAIDRTPMFINIYDPEYLYKWERPYAIYQFSDGSLWYRSSLGIFRFNADSNAWCWVATASGPLAEDGNGNLWLVDKQIYKYGYQMHP